MEVVLLAARVLLALIFGAAGAAKAADLNGSRQALVEFGVPEKLATPLGWGLPFVEILIAVALLPVASAWWGAVVALALLLVFAAGIGANLVRGRTPDCNCFGQLHSKPVSWSLFTRDLLLAAVAAFIIAQGGSGVGMSAFNWLADLNTGEVMTLVLGLAVIGLLTTAIVYLRRVFSRQTMVLDKIEAMKRVIDEDYAEPAPVERGEAFPPYRGLPVGAPAPDFSLPTLDGEQVTMQNLLAQGKSVLLLFVSPTCAPCKTLLPIVRAWERDYGDHLTIALLSKGTLKDNRDRVAKFGISRLLLQADTAVADDYQAKWTPAGVLVSPGGRIASQVAYGDSGIRGLINHFITTGAAVGKGSDRNIPQITVGNSLFKVGEPAPRFSLPDLYGKPVSTEDLMGGETLLLFWDSGCSFCQAMYEDIKAYEEKPPEGAPRIVIIASGKADDIKRKTKNFKSLVLLDPQFDIAPIFGSGSTPSAVLLDGEGRIASGLAEGGINILALVGVRKVELPIAPRVKGALKPQLSRVQ